MTATAAKNTTEGSNETMQTAADIETVARELLELVGAASLQKANLDPEHENELAG